MNKLLNRTTQNVLDVIVLSFVFWLAVGLRFDWQPGDDMLERHLVAWPYVVTLEFMTLLAFRVTRFSWRYVGLREANRIAIAVAASSSVLIIVRLVAGAYTDQMDWARFASLPLGVLFINAALALLGVTSLRATRRLIGEHMEREGRMPRAHARLRTLLVGAGESGVAVAREMSRRPDLGMLPVAFVDDERTKIGTDIFGIPVLGTMEDLPRIAAENEFEQVLITIANAPGHLVRGIESRCRKLGLPTKIIPGLYEIVGGAVNLTRIRSVAIDDLLRRDPVSLDEPLIADRISGRVVMVTGAGGSIGSELCRQVCRFGPARLLLVERSENALFEIHRELVANWASLQILPLVADVGDDAGLRQIFIRETPEVVFHAAAHKHVPMMEWNPGEAIKNNLIGTRNLADLAHEYAVRHFVMVSTDKAVNPTSVMGVTKRLAEIYIQALSNHSQTKFVAVRFGNVLGSAGSVVPLFKEQIARGGPVTVTHPDMRRYFMTVPEACQLVLQAGTMGRGGEIFILDMGDSVKIVDLARDLIRLSGLHPDEDIAIKFTGMRPGEKLFEELVLDNESAERTTHAKVFVARTSARSIEDARALISRLALLVGRADPAEIRAALSAAVPEYHPPDKAAMTHVSPRSALN